MKRFFALLLLGAMLFTLMPFALAEDTKETSGEAAPEETWYSAGASSVQNANRVSNTATSIAFGELRRTLNTYNYSVKALNEAIDATDSADQMIRESISSLETLRTQYVSFQSDAGAAAACAENPAVAQAFGDLYAYWTINIATVGGQIADLEAQLNNNVTVETTQNTCSDAINQIVKGAESLYIGILKMELALGDAQRGVDTLERVVKLTEKQKEIGMASDYDVESIRHQYVNARSQLDSLRYQIQTSKITLEGMLGMELSGTVALSTPTMPTNQEILGIDYERELSRATGRNVDVMNAEAKYHGDSADGSYESVRAAKDTFAYKFKIVCLDVPEKQRLAAVAEDAVSYQQRTFEIAAKKYELGMLSHEEYLNAQSEWEGAKTALLSARLDLFTAYRAYIWATQYGVV